MSAIDQYAHKCLGIVECPFKYEKPHALAYTHIPIYRLKQDIPSDESEFDGKEGDILVGGGSGESAAFRISIPEAFLCYTHDDWDNFDCLDEIYKNHWTHYDDYKEFIGREELICDGMICRMPNNEEIKTL